jgi:hypothetical protein
MNVVLEEAPPASIVPVKVWLVCGMVGVVLGVELLSQANDGTINARSTRIEGRIVESPV